MTGHIFGDEPCPPKFVPDEMGYSTTTVNPNYTLWKKKDQNLIIWIHATVSDSLLLYVIGFSLAQELWLNLENAFRASQEHT